MPQWLRVMHKDNLGCCSTCKTEATLEHTKKMSGKCPNCGEELVYLWALENFWETMALVHRLANIDCNECIVRQYAQPREWFTPLCSEGCAKALENVYNSILDESVGLI